MPVAQRLVARVRSVARPTTSWLGHQVLNVPRCTRLGGFIGALLSPCGPGFLNNRCNDDVYGGVRVPVGLELLLKRRISVETKPAVLIKVEGMDAARCIGSDDIDRRT